MTASRAQRERKAQEHAGELAEVRLHRDANRDRWVYKILCRECSSARGRWISFKAGHGNDYIWAMDRWILHLDHRHAGVDAPCLVDLDNARERDAKVRAEMDKLFEEGR